VTAHKLRHTFASILIALGRDPAYVMTQLGHADPGFTLRVYTHAMRRGDGEREALRGLVEGREWARMGTNAAAPDPGLHVSTYDEPPEPRINSGDLEVPPGGFEPPTPGLGRTRRSRPPGRGGRCSSRAGRGADRLVGIVARRVKRVAVDLRALDP
jgi:hypothetical protein